MTPPIYAIGDIHGHHDMLQTALARIANDGGADAPLVVLGDLVDRGPDSRAVIDTLMTGIAQGRNWTVLMGNHDRLFHNFLTDGAISTPLIRSGLDWLHDRLGGGATLASYGIDPDQSADDLFAAAQTAIPQAHRDFIKTRPLYHQTGDFLFVHAGIQPRLPLEWQSEDDLIWIRDPFLTHDEPFDWLVVHGHTARKHPEHCGNRVNLDGGTGWGRPLFPARITGRDVALLTADGPAPLTP